MSCKRFLSFCASLVCLYFAVVAAQNQGRRSIPVTRFTCSGRPSGYYADMETGCQVYHMCDGLGRQFSYTCPNTTLFQQRMLICDHWYMVNCSKSESDYDANLLIGQRDKPFVSDEEMQFRTPRPDILSVPPNSNYYDGLREAETKNHGHPGNSIVGIPDSISTSNNGLDSAKQNYRPPSSWSTGVGNRSSPKPNVQINAGESEDQDTLTGAASQRPNPTFRPTPTERDFTQGQSSFPTPPTRDLTPPLPPTTTEPSSEEFDLDMRMKEREDPVFNFIKRFDPNSPDSIKTSMTKTEIININQQLPDAQVSSEEERTPRRNKDNGNKINQISGDSKDVTERSRFDSVNVKPTESFSETNFEQASVPNRELLPPKSGTFDPPSTTIGPPIYYEWKWAVPAFGLEPPKASNDTNSTQAPSQPQGRNAGRSPFSTVTRPTPREVDIEPSNTEYNISSYFVPDYVFPLDKPHPGYNDENAETSFNVKVSRPGRSSYGENPACPHCHPAYLNPGTCEPCIVKR